MTSEPMQNRKTSGSSWLGYIVVGIMAGGFGGLISAVVCLAAVFVLLGGSDGKGLAPKSETAVEQGTADVTIMNETRKGETAVFYRRPFASPPQLTISGGSAFIMEQKADSFKVGRDVTGHTSFSTTESVTWKAEGIPK